MIVLVGVLLTSCASQPRLAVGASLPLSAFSDPHNDVSVSIRLRRANRETFLLEATFTPPAGYHLYSKDIPRTGVRGQGRPTLIELPAGAKMRAAGPLAESVGPYMPGYVPDGAPIYPAGPVTLTLPIRLPDQAGWQEDQVSLTYMACTDLECKEPTVGRLVSVRVPGKQSLEP